MQRCAVIRIDSRYTLKNVQTNPDTKFQTELQSISRAAVRHTVKNVLIIERIM